VTVTQFKDAPIFDADQHMYETPESLTKFLPEKYSRAVQFAQFGRHTRIVINNKVNDFIPNPTFERVAAPGAHEKFFAGENTEGLTLREMQGPAIDAPAATRNPVDRVAELDRQGVVEALNYPTLASLIEHATADDPELSLAVVHALNQWMLEQWTFNYEDRVFSTPIINLSEVDGAQRELEYLLANNVKVVLIKPGPVNGTLTRFPRLRIASVENGSSWIFPLFNDFEDLYKKMPQNFPEHPHEVFRRNIWVSPFWEGCVSDVVTTVGWDKVLFGSDYPHPEGLAEPKGFWRYTEGMDERRTYDFMGDNARRFMGLPIANPDPAAVNPPALSHA
jgi:predicted TIM-barrel fold metal-dependent hydrolase